MNENEMRTAFYKKKSNFRAAILTLDWSKDGLMALPGGRSYNYLSADKVKKNLAPLFPKFGLELEVDCEAVTQMEGIGNMSQHWIVKCNYTLIDVDTGYSVTKTSYGEAADSGDKGVGKARGHAFKRWAIEEFNLADGIDSDSTAYETGSRYKPMTEEEEAKVMSKVQEKAIQRAAALEASVPAPKSEKSAPAPKPAVPAPAPKAPAESKYVLAGPQKMAVDKITMTMTKKSNAGEITAEALQAMKDEIAAIDSGKKANEFIMKYQPMCS